MVHTDARKCEVSEMLEETMKENIEDIEKKKKKHVRDVYQGKTTKIRKLRRNIKKNFKETFQMKKIFNDTKQMTCFIFTKY